MMGSDYYETLQISKQISNMDYHNWVLVTVARFKMRSLTKTVRIGDDVRIIGGTHLADGDTPLYTVRDGIIVLKKGAIVPNGFTIGV